MSNRQHKPASTRLNRSNSRPPPQQDGKQASAAQAPASQLLDGLIVRAADQGEPGADLLRQAAEGQSERATQSLLHLQRHVGNRAVQRMLAKPRRAASETDVSPEVQDAIQRARGGGQSMPSALRNRMEGAFASDFGDVRIHSDGEADALSQAVNARAFTVGSDIFVRQGEYDPGSVGGRELLAHELTHVVQQAGVGIQPKLTINQPGDRFEQEADEMAAQAVNLLSSVPVQVADAARPVIGQVEAHDDGAQIQRWEPEGPFGILEPVHETLTQQALRAAGIIGVEDTYTSQEAWEYIRGAIWNDDPEGKLFDDTDWRGRPTTTNYSSGLSWKWDFNEGEDEAREGTRFGPKEVSLLKRSHYGDLQFLHGMAVKGEEASATQGNILKWAEFTYRVATGEIAPATRLGQIEGIQSFFPNLTTLRVDEFFCIRNADLRGIADVGKRAMGSLLHMIQDSFAAGHTEREGGTGRIVSFHSYAEQEHGKHGKEDVPSGKGATLEEQIANTPQAQAAVDQSARVLRMMSDATKWDAPNAKERISPKQLMEEIFLAENAKPAGPGEGFLKEKRSLPKEKRSLPSSPPISPAMTVAIPTF